MKVRISIDRVVTDYVSAGGVRGFTADLREALELSLASGAGELQKAALPLPVSRVVASETLNCDQLAGAASGAQLGHGLANHLLGRHK
jgi:hypothetical protein